MQLNNFKKKKLVTLIKQLNKTKLYFFNNILKAQFSNYLFLKKIVSLNTGSVSNAGKSKT